MLKNVKTFHPEALIKSKEFRSFVENFESELLRGISTITVLSIIEHYPTEGIYGYQLLKDLEQETNNLLVIEEGTLYPILRKMEREGILASTKRKASGRLRKYYRLTEEGKKVLNHLQGFFAKVLEAISPLMEFRVKLPKESFIYCPNCANKIALRDEEVKYCEVCGLYIEELKKR